MKKRVMLSKSNNIETLTSNDTSEIIEELFL